MAQPAVVQQVGAGAAGTGSSFTSSAPGTAFQAGNTLVALVWFSTSVAAPSSINTPAGWTSIGFQADGAPNGAGNVYVLPLNPTAAQTWTWTLTLGGATAQGWAYTIYELSGVSGVQDLTATKTVTGASSSATHDPGAQSGTTQSNDALLALLGVSNSGALTYSTGATSIPSSGWTVGTTFKSTAGSPLAQTVGMFQYVASPTASPDGAITSSSVASGGVWFLSLLAAPSGEPYPMGLRLPNPRVGPQVLRYLFRQPSALSNVSGGANSFTQSLSAGLSFTGPTNLTISTSKGVAGGLSFTGPAHLINVIGKGIAGNLSFTGIGIKNAITKGLASASLSFTGAINKLTGKALGAGLSFTGAIASAKVFLKSLSGTLSFTGPTHLGLSVGKGMTGALSFTGTGVKNAISKGISAALGFAGSLVHSGGGGGATTPNVALSVVSRHAVMRLFSRFPNLAIGSRRAAIAARTRQASLTVTTRKTSITVRSR